MRKVIALLLSIVLLLSMSATAFAADSQICGDGATGQSTVYYFAPSTYSIVIPETIFIAEGYTFTATEMNIQPQEQVTVRITNLTENDAISISHTKTGETLDLQITGLGANQTCAIFSAENLTSSISIGGQIINAGSNPKAGEYTGIMEFVIVSGGI